MDITTNTDLLTPPKAAKVIGISPAMADKLIASGDLPASRIGPQYRVVRRIDAERLREKREREGKFVR